MDGCRPHAHAEMYFKMRRGGAGSPGVASRLLPDIRQQTVSSLFAVFRVARQVPQQHRLFI